jgi:hypothetical protein
MLPLQRQKEVCMPPGWFVPIKGSNPQDRKQKIRGIAERAGGTVHCFWQEDGGTTCYALVEMDDPSGLDPEMEPGKNKVKLKRI